MEKWRSTVYYIQSVHINWEKLEMGVQYDNMIFRKIEILCKCMFFLSSNFHISFHKKRKLRTHSIEFFLHLKSKEQSNSYI